MNRRSQRGMIDNRPLLWIVPILVAVGWYNWPGGRLEIFTPTVVNWLIGIGLVLSIIFAVSLSFMARERGHRRDVARAVGSEVKAEYHSSWGRDTTTHYVPMRWREYTVRLMPGRGGTFVALEVARGGATPFAIDVAPDGAVTVGEAGRDAARSFLDDRVRSNLAGMAKLGKPAGLAIQVVARPEHLIISRYGAMSVRETLLFINLCRPVFDRALAGCFGKPVPPPGKTCATCGGECCPTCDVSHATRCGCAPI